jgi:hypothetical protein
MSQRCLCGMQTQISLSNTNYIQLLGSVVSLRIILNPNEVACLPADCCIRWTSSKKIHTPRFPCVENKSQGTFLSDCYNCNVQVYSNLVSLHCKQIDIIQLMTFNKVDIMIYQHRKNDNYRGQKSTVVFLNDFSSETLMLKELRFVHKNTPSNQNIRF